jgi:hypothetical protein
MDYEDPITQIFAGENIDMNMFINTIGPSPTKRAQNMAKDPFTSAFFLKFIIQMTLVCLLGIRVIGC